MTTEAKCPKCGAERTHDYPPTQGYECGTKTRGGRVTMVGARCKDNQLAALAKELAEAKRGAYNDIAGKCLQMLEGAGCGKPGTPNTLWAMVREIIEKAEKCRREGLEEAAKEADGWRFDPEIWPAELIVAMSADTAVDHACKDIAIRIRRRAAQGKEQCEQSHRKGNP